MAAKKGAKRLPNKKQHLTFKTGRREVHTLYKKEVSILLYWTTLLVLAVCNFLISVPIVLLLLMVNKSQIFIIIAMLGLFFGFIFNLLITRIEHLELKHHLFAAVFIPLVSVANIFLIVGLTNRIVSITGIGSMQNSITISLIYVGSFMLPYLYENAKRQKKENI